MQAGLSRLSSLTCCVAGRGVTGDPAEHEAVAEAVAAAEVARPDAAPDGVGCPERHGSQCAAGMRLERRQGGCAVVGEDLMVEEAVDAATGFGEESAGDAVGGGLVAQPSTVGADDEHPSREV